jgi:hypothetical protein
MENTRRILRHALNPRCLQQPRCMGIRATHFDRRHPDAKVFQRFQRLCKTVSLKRTALANAGLARTVRTPASEDATIAAVEREPWRSSSDIARLLELSQPRVTFFMKTNCMHTTTRGGHICFQAIVLYACNFAIGYAINTLRMSLFYRILSGHTKSVLCVRVRSTSTTVVYEHGMVLMLFANVGIKPASASAFGWYRREHQCWPLSATCQADCSMTS